jgi:hypothetical protein
LAAIRVVEVVEVVEVGVMVVVLRRGAWGETKKALVPEARRAGRARQRDSFIVEE